MHGSRRAASDPAAVTLEPMRPTPELPASVRGAVVLLVGALAAVVAVVQGPSPAMLLTAVAAVAFAGAVGVLAYRLVAVAAQRRRQIGGRAPRHRESLDRMAEPAHPGTAGTPRPRAPGAVLPAA